MGYRITDAVVSFIRVGEYEIPMQFAAPCAAQMSPEHWEALIEADVSENHWIPKGSVQLTTITYRVEPT